MASVPPLYPLPTLWGTVSAVTGRQQRVTESNGDLLEAHCLVCNMYRLRGSGGPAPCGRNVR